MQYSLVRGSLIMGYEEPVVCKSCRFSESDRNIGYDSDEIHCNVRDDRFDPDTMDILDKMKWCRNHRVDPLGRCPRFERRTW